VRGKVRRELDRLWAVRAELHRRDRDPVRARVAVGLQDAAPVYDRRVPFSLFGLDADVSEGLGGRDGSGLGDGWGSGKDVGDEKKKKRGR
jgi:hypothetical protein